jgi:hypothetical protein
LAIIRICAEEVSSLNENFAQSLTCTCPNFTPVGPGTHANAAVYDVAIDLTCSPPQLCFSYDVQLEYQYLNNGFTFLDFCLITNKYSCLTLPDGLTLCVCGLSPTFSYVPTASVTGATPTSVAGDLNIDFSVSDLCVPTSFCISTTDCPV